MFVEAKVIQVAANSSGNRVARVKGMISNYHTGNYYMTVIEGENATAFETYIVGTSGSAAGTFTMKYQPQAGYQQNVLCRLYLKIWTGGYTGSLGSLTRTDTGSNTALTAPTFDSAETTFGGNVGIGTTSPFGKLIIGSSASGSSDVDVLGFRSINNTAAQRDGYKQRIGFYSRNEYDNGDRLSAAIDCIYGDNVHLPTYPGTSSTNLVFTVHDRSNNIHERMRIQHDGNVGIGTTDPKAPLHVNYNKAIINQQMSLQTLNVYKDAGGNSGAQTKRYYRVYVPNGYSNFQIIFRGFARNYIGNGDIQDWRRQYTVQRNVNAGINISHDSGEDINASGFTFATSQTGGTTSVIEVHFNVTFPSKPENATYITFTAQVIGDTGYFANNTSI
jgi:hypothetical protein